MKPVLVTSFALSIIILSVFSKKTLNLQDVIIIGLATVRLATALSYNTVFDFLRRPFTKVVPDECGAGDCVVPDGAGWRFTVGELLSCPICTGTWSALIFLIAWQFTPVPVYIFAVAGIAEFLHWLFEILEWAGRLTRCLSGLVSPDKRG